MVKFHNSSPRIAEKILRSILPYDEREALLGDFEEIYRNLLKKRGGLIAHLWYWIQIIRLFPSFLKDCIYWRSEMIKNWLKIALRNIRRHKGYSFITTFGLAIGMACFILTFLWILDELSYDRFHEKADQIYRVAVRAKIGNTEINQTYTPPPLAGTLLTDYPEVLHSVRFVNYNRAVLIKCGEQFFNEYNVALVDASLFDVFTLRFIKGDPKAALIQPNTVVLTEKTAYRYFGNKNPIKQVLAIDNDNFQVTGVIENIPESSHFHFDFFISLTTFPGSRSTRWGGNYYKTYIVLREGCSKEEFETKLHEVVKKYIYKNNEDNWIKVGNYWIYYLQPLTKIHLHSRLDGEFEANGNSSYVSIFSMVAFFILVMSGINYMNLYTARSANRAMEVGIRKVIGSHRSQLIKQFLIESIVSSSIALLLAIAIVEILLPSFRNFVGKQLDLHYFGNLYVLPGLIGLALVIGTTAGAYPSFFLSSFQTISVLKSQHLGRLKNSWLRNGLVLIQFSISIFLIIGTLIVFQQLKYIQDRNLGFNKEHVVIIKTIKPIGKKSDVFKENLLKHPFVISASGSHSLPGRHFENFGFIPEGKDAITMNLCCCDYDFLETLGLEMKTGRFFSKDHKTDYSAIIINEAAVKLLGWKDPLNKYIFSNDQNLNVIGVVKDFHYQSLHQPVAPMALLLLHGAYDFLAENFISVRVKPGNIEENLKFIKKTWEKFFPGMPFDYSFLDVDYNTLYHNERLTGKTFTTFSLLAIFIASLGLFGLASLISEWRTKEIGIRKVFGASVSGIVFMLSKEFTKWVVISNAVAWPFAYYVMNIWLQNFAYRVNITLWSFIFAAFLSLTIALITVSYRSVRAAVSHPVNALRYE